MLAMQLVLLAALATSGRDDVAPLVVHEWGTFTAVVDVDGTPYDWYRAFVTERLPRFVHMKMFKLEQPGRIRMETPVLYFHAEKPLTVGVAVDFPAGVLTEWYPQASETTRGLAWHQVTIDPRAQEPLPIELGGAHYYAARGVGAAQVSVPLDGGGAEHEKFLFYRGVGTFDLPLAIAQEGEKLTIANRGKRTIGHAFFFERRDDVSTLIALPALESGGEHEVDRSALNLGPDSSLHQLKDALRADGLLEDEAEAMIATWRSTWFEPGVRVLFTLPREETDAILPLSISPEPSALERVMIGRIDVVTASMKSDLVAWGKSVADPAARTAESFGRACSRYGRVAHAVLTREADRVAAAGDAATSQSLYDSANRLEQWQWGDHDGALAARDR